MKITDELTRKVTGMGMLKYPPSKMANVLDLSPEDEVEFCRQLDDTSSDLSRAYQKGIDKADYLVDSKLFELAKTGDIKSIELLEKRRSQYSNQGEEEKLGRECKSFPPNE